MSGNDERIAQNEAIFRSVNEAIAAQVFRDPAADNGPWLFLCECADVTCTERIELTIPQYRAARSDPRRFAVRPDHVEQQYERVIERGAEFAIVEKTGAAGAAAERAI